MASPSKTVVVAEADLEDRARVVEIHRRVEAQTAFVGTAGRIVLHPKTDEGPHRAVVHSNVELDPHLAMGRPKKLGLGLAQAKHLGCRIEVAVDVLEGVA